MSPATHSRSRLVVLAVMLTTLLTGCVATLPEKNQQTPEQTHEAVRQAMESTIQVLGGPEGWSVYEEGSPNQCRMQGIEGVAYKELQFGPGVSSVAERDAVVLRVREHVEDLGMQTWIGEKTAADPMMRVLAEGGPTEGFSAMSTPSKSASKANHGAFPAMLRT